MAGTVLEQLAYGVARGVVRAYFDVLDEREVAVREVPDAADRVRTRQLAGAAGLPGLGPASDTRPGSGT